MPGSKAAKLGRNPGYQIRMKRSACSGVWNIKISLRRIGRILCGRTSLTSKYVHFMNPSLFETHYNNRGTCKIIISCPLEV